MYFGFLKRIKDNKSLIFTILMTTLIAFNFVEFAVLDQEARAGLKVVRSNSSDDTRDLSRSEGLNNVRLVHSIYFELKDNINEDAVLYVVGDWPDPNNNMLSGLAGITNFGDINKVSVGAEQQADIIGHLSKSDLKKSGKVQHSPNRKTPEDEKFEWFLYSQKNKLDKVVLLRSQDKNFYFVDLDLIKAQPRKNLKI